MSEENNVSVEVIAARDAIVKEIVGLVHHQWDSGNQPLLLSQILPRLSENAAELYRVHFQNSGMKEFITQSIAATNAFKLIQDPFVAARIGIIPPDAEFSYSNDAELFHLKEFLKMLSKEERMQVSVPGTTAFKLCEMAFK